MKTSNYLLIIYLLLSAIILSIPFANFDFKDPEPANAVLVYPGGMRQDSIYIDSDSTYIKEGKRNRLTPEARRWIKPQPMVSRPEF